jgi:hypothetical protein
LAAPRLPRPRDQSGVPAESHLCGAKDAHEFMLKLETKSDLDRLIADDIQESLTLDYKDARALGKTDKQRNELCKDASAFANSAGGQIIYGIEEKDHQPARVQDSDSVDPVDITREWIEQVIDSNIQPRIQNLGIQLIDVATKPKRVAYVITIPQATTSALHQAPDNKYYYRQNFQSVPMEDYQVRDTMRRATTPELYVRLSLAGGKRAVIELAHQAEMSKPILLNAFVGNRSAQPAFHTFVELGIDTGIGSILAFRFNLAVISSLLASAPTPKMSDRTGTCAAFPRRLSCRFSWRPIST